MTDLLNSRNTLLPRGGTLPNTNVYLSDHTKSQLKVSWLFVILLSIPNDPQMSLLNPAPPMT